MKLTELQPQFIRLGDKPSISVHVKSLAEATGITFLCPKCWTANGNTSYGTHTVKCWFEGVPLHIIPGPGRWKPKGTGYADLSFVPGLHSRSVRLIGGCAWHGYITKGEVTDA